MIVNIITVKLYAPWIHSLKEKRMIVKSLCEKLRSRFHVCAIESDAQDVHKTIVISVVFPSLKNTTADSTYEAVHDFLERSTDAQIVEIYHERR